MKIENVEFENTPTLVIVRGIPGSGKSTFAEYCVKKLAEEHITATHCESDDYWMRMVFTSLMLCFFTWLINGVLRKYLNRSKIARLYL